MATWLLHTCPDDASGIIGSALKLDPRKQPVTNHQLLKPAFFRFQITLISLFVGTIFWQMDDSVDFARMNLRRGVGFLSLMSTFLCNAIQLPGQLADRAVFYKQQSARFYRPGSYLLASVAANFPFSCLEVSPFLER